MTFVYASQARGTYDGKNQVWFFLFIFFSQLVRGVPTGYSVLQACECGGKAGKLDHFRGGG